MFPDDFMEADWLGFDTDSWLDLIDMSHWADHIHDYVYEGDE